MSFIVKTNAVNKAIPDNKKTGLSDTIKVFKGGKVKDLEVSVNIKHPYSGDLEVTLTSPSGKSAILHSRTGSSKGNLKKVFSKKSTTAFTGQKVNGNWKLTVKDYAPRDSGTLISWSIRLQNDATSEDSEIYIPDGKGKKLVSHQLCNVAGKIKDISASVDIKHGYIGDLQVTLIGPDASVKLHNRTDGNKKNLKRTYKAKDLAAFIGKKAKGTWTLEVSDHAPRDSGRIKGWHIDLVV